MQPIFTTIVELLDTLLLYAILAPTGKPPDFQNADVPR
jgi:hypothetical protein